MKWTWTRPAADRLQDMREDRLFVLLRHLRRVPVRIRRERDHDTRRTKRRTMILLRRRGFPKPMYRVMREIDARVKQRMAA